MASSGTQAFAPAFSDLLLDVFARIQVRPAAITADHMFQARMSASLMLSEWATTNVPHLWKVEELVIPLQQGVPTYQVPASTVGILDYVARQYQMTKAASVAPNASTTAGSAVVTVVQPNHGLTPGAYVTFVVPVAVGGIILFGTYPTLTVVDVNTYQITAINTALTTEVAAGVVPVFTSTPGSSSILVTLPRHGLSHGQQFQVEVPTTVGGLVLTSVYSVTAVIDPNNFLIDVGVAAGSSESVFENNGLAYIETQTALSDPTDRVLFPLSRSDYAAIPNKRQQSFPTSVWFNRQINPTVTLWPTPDGNGPYELRLWAMVQFDDIVSQGGVGVDVPWRFLEAFAAGLAAKLAVKFPPPAPNSVEKLITLADRAWDRATTQDVEDAPLYIVPMMSGYFGG